MQQIRSISSDEDEIYIRHVGGSVKVLADSAFKAPLIRLMAQNPAIDLEDRLSHDVEEVASATGTQGGSAPSDHL